jgi:hypothetical protein
MSVWDVEDAEAESLGAKVGALDFVSHCYLRPRPAGLALQPVCHAARPTRDEVEAKRAEVARPAGPGLPQPRHPVFHPHPEKDGPAPAGEG